MKTWEIYHYTYSDVCDDQWYGKTSKYVTMGYVTDTEENIKALVEKLNVNNHSYYAQEEPEDDEDFVGFDEEWYLNEDYIAYREVVVNTIEQIEKRYIR